MGYRTWIILSMKSLFLLILAGSTLLAGCKTQEFLSHWSSEPVVVDGEMTDWPGGSTAYFEDLGLQLGLRNDDQNLYVLFRFNNQAWANAIRMGGVTLWLDNSGKKKKDFGLRYTGGPPPSISQMEGISDRGGFKEAMTPEQQQRLSEMEKNMADRITLIDKKSNQEISLRPDGSDGVSICYASPQGIYTYEFSIPLKKGNVFDCGIGATPGQTVSLGFEWGGMSKEDRQKMAERMGGAPPGGGMGGGPPGGGMGGTPPEGMGGGPGGGSRPQIAEKQELWVKTRLATPVEK